MDEYWDLGLDARDCGSVELMSKIPEAVRDYAMVRVRGYYEIHAWRRVFGPHYCEQEAMACARALECNPIYVKAFENVLATAPIEKLWSPRICAFELLSIVRDPVAKEAVKVSAIKELNVMFEITFTDEKGNTRANKTLNDFYPSEKLPNGQSEGAAISQTATTRHPEPGTPEAEAIEMSE